MKAYRLLLAVLAAVALTASASAQGWVSRAAPVNIRSAAILTNADVLTTFSADTLGASLNRIEAVHVYVDFTTGSLTNVKITPAGAKTGNPDSTGYYQNATQTRTFTVANTYGIRIPIEEFCGAQYFGIVAVGTGTVTNSSLTMQVKPELKW